MPPGLLISATELHSLDRPFTLLDVRYRLGGPPGAAEYARGHIPGAAYVDLDTALAAPPGAGGRHPLPDPRVFEAAMRAAGVRNNLPVVVYDDWAGRAAARCWWLLRWAGHEDVRVLDGGWSAWVAAARHQSDDHLTPTRGDFTARPGQLIVVSADEVLDLAERGVLIDARNPERFRGDVEPVDPVAGHIPGAVNVPTSANLADDGRFRSPEELREVYSMADGQPVAAYCGSGVTAAQGPSGTLERVRHRHQILTLALSSALLLGGCGGGSESEQGDGRKAAEPAGSSELSAPPAGTVKQVAPQPQGTVYDAASDSLVVAVRNPDRVLVLDPTTLQQRLSVDLPGKVRHLQTSAQGGTVLVPVETANKIFEVDLTDGDLRATDVQRHPHDAAGAPNGDVLVGNEFSGSLSVVRRGRVTHTFTDLSQPGGVVAEGDTAVVVDVRDYSITTYDIEAEKRISRLPAGEGPTHGVVADQNKVAVTDTRGDEVLLYTIDPLEKIGAIPLPDSPYGLTADPSTQTVWVTLTGTNELVGLDVSGSTPSEIARYPTVRQPDTVAVAPGSKTLWVTGRTNGEIQRITR